MQTLGARFKHLRESHNFTQLQLAEGSGIARTTLASMETNMQPKFETLRLAAEPLKLTEAEWLSLVVLWVEAEIGEDANKLTITTRYGHNSNEALQQWIECFSRLTPKGKSDALSLMCLPDVEALLVLDRHIGQLIGRRHDNGKTPPEKKK